MLIKECLKKIIMKEEYSSETFVSYLKKKGVSIGEDCIIYAPRKTTIDLQYPWLITIGNHVRITQGVVILTHDYAWSVLKLYKSSDIDEGVILGASGPVCIGDNVFIGMNTIITRNVKIGDNVVIGAGSVVTKDCASNSVYAGNPARRIMSIEEYYQKRMKQQVQEAKILAQTYIQRYGKMPDESIFHEYFMLFKDSICELNAEQKKKLSLCQNYENSVKYINKNRAPFRDFEDFIKFCADED